MDRNINIIVVGMPRSGTTFVTNILAHCKNVQVLIEPHILWRTGNFMHFYDNVYQLNTNISNRIKKRLVQYTKNKILVEKSPINCVRSTLVHSVLPNAKIVYIERDKERCIKSNIIRFNNNDSFKLSIIIRKYFGNLPKDMQYADQKMSFWKQIYFSDFFYFLSFFIKSIYHRNFLKIFPFGIKLKHFFSYIKTNGIYKYYEKVYSESLVHKKQYQELYKANFADFNLEKLQKDSDEVIRLLDFCNLDYNKNIFEKILATIDKKRI